MARTRSCRPITTLYAHRGEPNEENGEEQLTFRRNTAFGTPSEHGTLFVGFSADQHRLARMLNWMVGAEGGIRDALTYYTTPLTGAYYFVPSVQALRSFAAEET